MPTGARLISAIFFGFLTYIATHIVHAAFEADVGYDLDFGRFKEITAVIGLLTGWIVQGNRAGEGRNFAIQGGILTSFLIVFWSLTLWSLVEMIQESMKMKYRGATQALVDTFRIALDYAATFGNLTFIATMVIGGILGGMLAEWAASRYR